MMIEMDPELAAAFEASTKVSRMYLRFFTFSYIFGFFKFIMVLGPTCLKQIAKEEEQRLR